MITCSSCSHFGRLRASGLFLLASRAGAADQHRIFIFSLVTPRPDHAASCFPSIMSWIPFVDYLSKVPPEEPKADAVQEARFQKLLQQERIIQSANVTEKEMPSCMTLFDEMMRCHGEHPHFSQLYQYPLTHSLTHPHSSSHLQESPLNFDTSTATDISMIVFNAKTIGSIASLSKVAAKKKRDGSGLNEEPE